MDRRTFCVATAAALSLGSATTAQAEDAKTGETKPGLISAEEEKAKIVKEVNDYLNAITTMKGDFVQIAPDGVISEGKFVMRRPGRILFKYLPPSPTRVIADGFWVAVVDDSTKTTPDRYPLSETPLNLILKEDIDLTKENAIKSVESREGKYRLTAIDPSGEAQGSILLVFATQPLMLEQWVVVDGQGLETSVILRNVETGVDVDAADFTIPDYSLEKSDDR